MIFVQELTTIPLPQVQHLQQKHLLTIVKNQQKLLDKTPNLYVGEFVAKNIRILESTFSQQTVKLFEVIQEVDLVKVSKLNGLVMNKIQGMRAAVFSRKKEERCIDQKEKWIHNLCCSAQQYLSLVDGLRYEIIESSDLQEIFSSISKC